MDSTLFAIKLILLLARVVEIIMITIAIAICV